jgi:Planctomycete cytochrome C
MISRITRVNSRWHPLWLVILSTFAVQTVLAADVDIRKLPPVSTKEGVTFDKDIRPLFQASCVRCHSGERAKRGLRLDTRENVLKGSNERKVVIPGDSAHSLLVIAAARIDDKTAMPPKPRQRPSGPPGTAPQSAPGNSANPFSGEPQQMGMPLSKPLTPEEVGLVRAWIDQGAK